MTHLAPSTVEDDLRRRAEEYRIHHEIDRIIQEEEDLDPLLARVLEAMVNMAELEVECKAGIFLLNGAEQTLDLIASYGQFSAEFLAKERRIPLGACLCGRAAISGELITSED
jgi:hypothetical protein